jgi:hypothetical protein
MGRTTLLLTSALLIACASDPDADAARDAGGEAGELDAAAPDDADLPSPVGDARPNDASVNRDALAAADTATPLPEAALADAQYRLDFAAASIENPLSAGGIWTNNSQGTGGNVAPGNMTSMQVGLASDGMTRIAFDSHGGINYDDSFAFVPGFAGDQYIEAVIYKEAGYNPNASGSNHELELILGCSSAAGSRIWNEFLFNAGGGVDIVYLNGGPSDFQSIANVGGVSGHIPVDGDVVRATRVGNVLTLYINGAVWTRYNGANPAVVAKGSGIGIAAFIRPGATHNKFGFKRVEMGAL